MEMQKRSVLITGATGIYGSWVLSEALLRGYRPIVLMRNCTVPAARDRLNAVLAVTNPTGGGRYIVDLVWGDIRKPNLGMDPRIAESVRDRIVAIINCAGCTSFNPKDDATVWDTNVHGVEHLLDFLSGSNVPLYHVSTAYVAGGREGVVNEYELDGRYGFTNTYESSKWQAERMLRAAFVNGDVSGAVFRPGILAGASTNGAITDFQNLYRFFRLVDMASIQSNLGACTIRIEGRPDTFSNLVPVDWAAKAMWEIVEHEGPACRTYHLTNPNPNTLEELRAWADRKLRTVNARIRFVDELDGRLSFIEAFAAKSLRHYSPYTRKQPYFDTTSARRVTQKRLPFPELDHRYYDKLFAYAKQHAWRGAIGPALTTTNNTAFCASNALRSVSPSPGGSAIPNEAALCSES